MNTLSLLKDFERSFIGFDRVFNEIANAQSNFVKSIPSFPPYNIKKVDDKTYTIELAVAGFGKSDIDVEMDGDTLKVSGRVNQDESNYLYKGIAERAFSRQWKLADSVEVKNATMVNGMLKITLENMLKLQPTKKIEVVETDTTPAPVKGKKQLLTEEQ
jgi:molecular chaperone IbpA